MTLNLPHCPHAGQKTTVQSVCIASVEMSHNFGVRAHGFYRLVALIEQLRKLAKVGGTTLGPE
jgi:hypothetical protein